MPPCINATISILKDLQHNFPKMRGGGVKGRLEFFQNFIRFGSGILPLPSLYLIKPSKLPYQKIKISLLMNVCCPKSARVIIIVIWWGDCQRYYGRKWCGDGCFDKTSPFFTLPMIHPTLRGKWMNPIVWNSVDRSRLFLGYFCH